MIDLPRLEHLGGGAEAAAYRLWPAASDAAFAGHFPDAALLPGVVQLNWALSLARQAGLVAAETGPRFKVKFKHPIRPGDVVDLQLDLARGGHELRFEYRIGEELASSGSFTLP